MKKLITLLTCLLSFNAFATFTDRYVTSAGAGSADGTSEANAMSFATFKDYMEVGGSFTAAAGDRFNIKGNQSRTTTSDTFVNGGTATSPVIIRGYGTAIGDGYQGRANNGTGALVTSNMPNISYTTGLMNLTGSFIILESVQITGTRSGVILSLATGADCGIVRCLVSENSTNGSAACCTLNQARAFAFDCDMELVAASGGLEALLMPGSGSRAMACRITGKTAPAIIASNTSQILNCILYNSTIGISVTSTTAAMLIAGCTITGNSGDGIDVITATTVTQTYANNIITDNGGYGIDFNNAATAPFLYSNRTRDNALGAYNLATDWVAATNYGAVTTDTGGAETDYTNAGSLDYRLISTSPAKGAGLPPSMSMGAYQSAGGGSYSFAQ